MRPLLPIVACLLFAVSLVQAGLSPEASARKLFGEYVELAQSYDPAISQLYDKNAQIRSIHVSPDGKESEYRLSAEKYKHLIKAAMRIAEERGDASDFTQVNFESKDGGVLIRAKRYSRIRDQICRFLQFVRPDSQGNWRIVEEVSYYRD